MFAALLVQLCHSLRRRPAKRPSRLVPQLLWLEDRTLPSTFTVVNLNDHGPGSLRDAIDDANANPGGNTVAFGEPRGKSGETHASYAPMFAHLALVLLAGVYMPPALVGWFQNVAKLLG